MTGQQFEALRQTDDPKMHVWRTENKAWNNRILMQRMITAISRAVSHLVDFQPVLIIDVAPCHIDKSVMHKARSLGIWLVYVPSQITFLVQPLDTHGFASFKMWL